LYLQLSKLTSIKNRMIKEVCVETFKEAKLAEKQGANRIELCSDLANDGLTPSSNLMSRTILELKIPIMVIVRPRAGNFVHTKKEVEQMKKDIDAAKQAGAAGVVFGLLTSDNKIDIKNTRILAEYASPLPVTFHKAIDELENPVEGVNELLEIDGIKRILTSGGAGDKITILVAGKVLDSNVSEIQKITGTEELHGRRIVGEL